MFRQVIAFASKKLDRSLDFVHCGFRYEWKGIPLDDPTSSVRPTAIPETLPVDDYDTDEGDLPVAPFGPALVRVSVCVCAHTL